MASKAQLAGRLNAHDEIKLAVDYLLNVAVKYKVSVAGFLWASNENAMLYNFGNCKEAAKIETYDRLVKLADERRASGKIVHLKPTKPS